MHTARHHSSKNVPSEDTWVKDPNAGPYVLFRWIMTPEGGVQIAVEENVSSKLKDRPYASELTATLVKWLDEAEGGEFDRLRGLD